jgi:hypothetical protein
MELQQTRDYKEEYYQAARQEAAIRAARKAEFEMSSAELFTYGVPVANSLRLFGACAVVLMDGSTEEQLIDSLSLRADDKQIHDMDADGNIQGQQLDEESARFAVRELQHMKWSELLILRNVDFHNEDGRGTPVIYDQVEHIVNSHFNSSMRNLKLPMILAIGRGTIQDMATSPYFDRSSQAGLAAGITNRFAIVEGHAPTPYVEASDDGLPLL